MIEARLQPTDEHIIRAGDAMAECVQMGNPIIFDVDNVLFRGDNLTEDQPTHDLIIPGLQLLESKRGKLGLATARGTRVLETFRQQYGVDFRGPAILEEGHLYIDGDTTHVLSTKSYFEILRCRESIQTTTHTSCGYDHEQRTVSTWHTDCGEDVIN